MDAAGAPPAAPRSAAAIPPWPSPRSAAQSSSTTSSTPMTRSRRRNGTQIRLLGSRPLPAAMSTACRASRCVAAPRSPPRRRQAVRRISTSAPLPEGTLSPARDSSQHREPAGHHTPTCASAPVIERGEDASSGCTTRRSAWPRRALAKVLGATQSLTLGAFACASYVTVLVSRRRDLRQRDLVSPRRRALIDVAQSAQDRVPVRREVDADAWPTGRRLFRYRVAPVALRAAAHYQQIP